METPRSDQLARGVPSAISLLAGRGRRNRIIHPTSSSLSVVQAELSQRYWAVLPLDFAGIKLCSDTAKLNSVVIQLGLFHDAFHATLVNLDFEW